MLIEGKKEVINNIEVYDFHYINWFWIGSALISILLVTGVAGIQMYKKSEINRS